MIATKTLLLTTMCLRYPPTVIACFCIYLVHKWSNLEVSSTVYRVMREFFIYINCDFCGQIPRSMEGKEWYSYIDSNVTAEILDVLTSEFLSVFDKLSPNAKRKILSCGAPNGPSVPSHLLPSTSSQDPNRRSTAPRPVEVNHRSSHGAPNSVSVHRGPQVVRNLNFLLNPVI